MSPLKKPILLLALAACLTAVIVQPGDLGSIDTTRRLQTTHSLWTSAPPVKTGDYPNFGIVGRNGQIFSWYGIGQSVLMLPSDILITAVIRLVPALHDHQGFREVFVSYTVSTFVCVLAILLCFRFLLLLGFAIEHSIAGALTLLLATSFLHYTQNMMENNFMLLLTLAGFCFQYEWTKTNSTRALLLGSAALGANLLTRLTAGLDLMAVMLFVGLCVHFESGFSVATVKRLIQYARVSFPIYALFLAMDRGYHFYRFGSFKGTYIAIFAEQFKLLHPSVSSNFPFSGPFWAGVSGPFISPEKSIFLFDPMLIITAALAIRMWGRLAPPIRAFLTSAIVLLLAYIIFHAKISYEAMLPAHTKGWAGDVAWGDRYITAPVQLLAMISVPLLLEFWASLQAVARGIAIAIGAASVTIQIASTIFWCPLEFAQAMTLPKPVFVIGLRFMNIVAAIVGKTKAWGLSNYLTVQSAHNTIPYFYPIWAMKESAIPHLAALIVVAAWFLLIIMLIPLLFRIYNLCKSTQDGRVHSAQNHHVIIGVGESI
jgi:hypothetical protein